MGGGVLDPNNPYLIPFKVAATLPLVLASAAAAPLVVDAGLLHGHRLLSPAQTISGLGVKWVQTKQKWSRIKTGLTMAGLLMPGYHKNPFSSGGGGPGESPTSTDSPPALHQQGQPVPVVVPAASDSAHGGGRSGAKPRKRKRCPPGHHWSTVHRRCVKTYPGWQKHW